LIEKPDAFATRRLLDESFLEAAKFLVTQSLFARLKEQPLPARVCVWVKCYTFLRSKWLAFVETCR
jgi:hypothetical protein